MYISYLLRAVQSQIIWQNSCLFSDIIHFSITLCYFCPFNTALKSGAGYNTVMCGRY
jgi:hypothetical protein